MYKYINWIFLLLEWRECRYPNGFEVDKSLHRKAGDI